MKGVWSQANHVQAIHSHRPILRSKKLLGPPRKKFQQMKNWWMKKKCLQDEGDDCPCHFEDS